MGGGGRWESRWESGEGGGGVVGDSRKRVAMMHCWRFRTF